MTSMTRKCHWRYRNGSQPSEFRLPTCLECDVGHLLDWIYVEGETSPAVIGVEKKEGTHRGKQIKTAMRQIITFLWDYSLSHFVKIQSPAGHEQQDDTLMITNKPLSRMVSIPSLHVCQASLGDPSFLLYLKDKRFMACLSCTRMHMCVYEWVSLWVRVWVFIFVRLWMCKDMNVYVCLCVCVYLEKKVQSSRVGSYLNHEVLEDSSVTWTPKQKQVSWKMSD